MTPEENFRHILENSIHIQDPNDKNTIGWFYPNKSELRNIKLCKLLNKEYEIDLENYDMLIGQNLKSDCFWLHYDKIWSFFESCYNMCFKDIQSKTQELLEQQLKRRGITTYKKKKTENFLLEQHLKRRGITTPTIDVKELKIKFTKDDTRRKFQTYIYNLKHRSCWNNA